jgi:hypothetical protein
MPDEGEPEQPEPVAPQPIVGSNGGVETRERAIPADLVMPREQPPPSD